MRRPISLLSLTVLGLSFVGLSFVERDPKILYNPSPSAPIGWYKISPSDDYSVGDRVAVWLPESAEKLAVERGYLPKNIPVIKWIKAGPGDKYCIKNQTLTLARNRRFAILSLDRQGRELPVLPDGCRSLGAQEFLVLSDRVSSSFDSRYFGAVHGACIIGVAEFVGTPEAEKRRDIPEEGGARGPGAQGKIKEPCTKPFLEPCLHIDFYCTKNFGFAPVNLTIPSIYNSRRLHNATILHDCSSESVDE